MTYQQQDNARSYARTEFVLSKSKVLPEKKKVRSQAMVIYDLLKGDYNSVFEHFMMRYALPGDFDLSMKFRVALGRVDK